jgi:hypothetical protein
VRFVVGDPSTYLYLDAMRPFTNGTRGFGVPQGALGQPTPWLPARWARSAIDGSDWLPVWNESCASYNFWRFGLEHLDGYYKDHHAAMPSVRDTILAAFPDIDMTYLVATNDKVNCRLDRSSSSSSSSPGCNDNELATYCQAMLQGENRLDRALKWKSYLRQKYGREVHKMTFVEGVQHDPIGLMQSDVGRCVIFGACL